MFSLSTCHATFSVLLCAGTLYGGSSSHDQSIIDLSAQLSRRSNGSVSFTQNDQSQFYTTTSLFLPHSDANHSFIIRLPHTSPLPSSPLPSSPLTPTIVTVVQDKFILLKQKVFKTQSGQLNGFRPDP